MSENRMSEGRNTSTTGSGTGGGTGSTTGSGMGTGTTGTGGTGTGTGAATALSQTGQKISDAATQAKEYVSDKVAVVGDKLKELQNTDFKEVAENAKDYARKNPGQAILISAAAGLVLGLILRGARR